MLVEAGQQDFQGVGAAFLVVVESFEQSSMLVLSEPDCREFPSVLDCRFLEVVEDARVVVADSLIERAQTVNDVLCNPEFRANFQRLLPRNDYRHVLPAEICDCAGLLLLCFVDLTSLAIHLHFELDSIAGSGVAGNAEFWLGRGSTGLLKERPDVFCVGCDLDLVLVVFGVLLCGRLEDVAVLGGWVVGRSRVLASVEGEGIGGRLDRLEEGVDHITCIDIKLIGKLKQLSRLLRLDHPALIIYFKSILSMSGTRNWNDMSSSEEDSWFDDEEVPTAKNAEVPQPPKQEGSSEPVSSQKPEPIPKPVEEKQKPAKQVGERKHSFLKDEDLLVEYSNKTVDDPRVIKAVRVNNQEHKELLGSLKNARVKQIREGVFILNFQQPEGVLQFIREKIANRYRFFLQPYFKSKRQGQEEGRPAEERKEHERKERRPRNQEDHEEGKRTREDRREREPRREKEEKKVYVQKECFELESNKNILHIKSEAFEIGKILAELEEKKIFKKFSKLYIKTPSALLDKVLKLVAEIAFKHKYNLDKEPQAASSEEIVQLTLIEGLKPPPKPVEKHEKKEEAARPARKQKEQPRAHKEREVVAAKEEKHGRRLGGSFEEYFGSLSTNNLSEIVKGFDENEYVKGLKENNSAIFDKNWKAWKIEAEEEFIEPLLKLVHRLKKSTIYDIDLKPSKRNERALLTAELRTRPEKERRPKVDASGVNGYLS